MVGDKDQIIVRANHVILPGSVPLPSASDMYYADIYTDLGEFSSWDINNNDIFAEYNWEFNSDNLDFYPDIYLGRLPCVTKEEVKIVVNKIINYEKLVYEQDWLNNVIICAGDTFPLGLDMLLRIALLPSVKLPELLLREGEYVEDIIADILDDYNVKKLYSSQPFAWNNKKPLTHFNIANEVNKGASIILFLGHGNV